MSDESNTNGSSGLDGGVLASLPRTRPQRASRRRETARAAAVSAKPSQVAVKPATRARPAAKPKTALKSKPTTSKPEPTATRPKTWRTAARREPPVPPQGFEPESEAASTAAITPPTGTELLSSLADVAGELFGAGLSSGGRLLRDALSRL